MCVFVTLKWNGRIKKKYDFHSQSTRSPFNLRVRDVVFNATFNNISVLTLNGKVGLITIFLRKLPIVLWTCGLGLW